MTGDPFAALVAERAAKTEKVVEELLRVIDLQHRALVEIRPLLHAATVDLEETLAEAGVPFPLADDLRLVDAAIKLGAGLLEHVDELTNVES